MDCNTKPDGFFCSNICEKLKYDNISFKSIFMTLISNKFEYLDNLTSEDRKYSTSSRDTSFLVSCRFFSTYEYDEDLQLPLYSELTLHPSTSNTFLSVKSISFDEKHRLTSLPCGGYTFSWPCLAVLYSEINGEIEIRKVIGIVRADAYFTLAQSIKYYYQIMMIPLCHEDVPLNAIAHIMFLSTDSYATLEMYTKLLFVYDQLPQHYKGYITNLVMYIIDMFIRQTLPEIKMSCITDDMEIYNTSCISPNEIIGILDSYINGGYSKDHIETLIKIASIVEYDKIHVLMINSKQFVKRLQEVKEQYSNTYSESIITHIETLLYGSCELGINNRQMLSYTAKDFEPYSICILYSIITGIEFNSSSCITMLNTIHESITFLRKLQLYNIKM